MPLEPGRIGQDRQAGRAAGLIGAGVIGWIKIFSYQSLGWRSFLYLCDQAEPARGDLGPKRGGEAAHRTGIDRIERRARAPLAAFGDLLRFGGQNFGELVDRKSLVSGMSVSVRVVLGCGCFIKKKN